MKIKKALSKIFTFLREVKAEMKRVNWLTKRETLRYTLIVIVVAIVFAIFLGGLDYLFTLFLDKIIH